MHGIQFLIENSIARDINLLNLKITKEGNFKIGEMFLLPTLIYS